MLCFRMIDLALSTGWTIRGKRQEDENWFRHIDFTGLSFQSHSSSSQLEKQVNSQERES